MAEVVVQYGDLSMVRVPWAEKHTLITDNVLSISVLHPNRPNTRKRYQAAIDHDFYVLIWDEFSSCLWAYDDNMWWFDLEEAWLPQNETNFYHKFPFILPQNSIVFTGVLIDNESFEQAKLDFNDRTKAMF